MKNSKNNNIILPIQRKEQWFENWLIDPVSKIKHDKFKFSSVSGQLSRTWFTNSEFLRKEMAETFLIG